MLAGLVIAWRFAHLSGWFAAFGVLLAVQALGYMAFVNRLRFDLGFWRRNWLQVTIACAIWSTAVDAVAEQINFVLGAVLTVFTCFWIVVMLVIYVGLRRSRSSV